MFKEELVNRKDGDFKVYILDTEGGKELVDSAYRFDSACNLYRSVKEQGFDTMLEYKGQECRLDF